MPPRFVVMASAISLLAAVVLAPVGASGSQAAVKFKAGDTIYVTVDSTELMVGQKTLGRFDSGAALKVLSVLDTWVQVEVDIAGKPTVGWVRGSNVSRVKPAPQPAKTERQAKTPTVKPPPKKDQPQKDRPKTSNNQPIAKSRKAENSEEEAQEETAASSEDAAASAGKAPTGAKSKQGAAQSKSKSLDEPTKVPSEKQGSELSRKIAPPPSKERASEPAKRKAIASSKQDPAETVSTEQPPTATTPDTEKKAVDVSKPETTEPETSGAGPEAGEPGEGPESLAERFAQILAEKRQQQAAQETAPKSEPKKPAAAPPKPAVKKTVPEVSRPATMGVLVLRIADDLADIDKTERIEQLILSGDEFTNRSLRNLAGLSVASLSIEAINVSNTGVQYVKDVRGVRILRLWSPGIDDESLTLVAQLSDLQILDIEGTAIEGTKFEDLQDLQELESVLLGPKVSDATIANLVHLPALQQLDLRACGRLTLDCLEPLATLKDLKVIWLPRHLRTKGKRALKLTLPECQVRS